MKNLFFVIVGFCALATLVSCEDENENNNNTVKVDKFQISENLRIRSIEFISNTTGLLCCGEKNTSGSIYRTTDGGETWNRSFHSDSLSVNDVFYLNDTIVFACGDSLLFLKSKDGGNTWFVTELPNLPYEEYYVPYNSVYANSEENIFLIGGEHYYKGLWSETETGAYPWIHDSYDNQFNSMCFVSEYVGFFAGYGILIVTEDGGNTFDDIDLYGNDFVDLEIDKYLTVYALSDYGILYSTTDLGYNWTTEIDEYDTEFTDMYFGDNVSVVCGKSGIVYLRKENENSWTLTEGIPEVDFYSSFVKDNDEIVLGAANGEIYILNHKRTR